MGCTCSKQPDAGDAAPSAPPANGKAGSKGSGGAGAAGGAASGAGAGAEIALTVDDNPRPVDRRGRKIEDDYQIQRKIGSGNYSVVHQGVNLKTREKVAIKIATKVSLTQEDIDAVYVEVDVLQRLDHPNVVKLLAFYEDKRHFYLVMELLTGGELLESLLARSSYSEVEARTLVQTLADAIGYCHTKGVVHRDLKLENVLLSSSEANSVVKIADFGFAKRFESFQELTTSCGTPGYVAPEILNSSKQWYGPQVDVWSLGVIMYILLVGYPPFTAETQPALFRKIKRGEYDVEGDAWEDISAQAKDLVKRMLTVDPKARITPSQIMDHPWLSATSISARDLPQTRNQLAGYMARRRMRRAFNVVAVTNRLKSISSGVTRQPEVASPSQEEESKQRV